MARAFRRKARALSNSMGEEPRKGLYLKGSDEIAAMRRAGHLLQRIMLEVMDQVAPGITTLELDKLAHARILEARARPAFLNLYGFPATLCISLNEEVVHGIPSKRVVAEGDIVSVDCGLIIDGWFSDMAYSRIAGQGTAEARELLRTTQQSLLAGIAAVAVDARLRDVGGAIEDVCTAKGYGVVDQYCGHGIGRALHEEPQVHNVRDHTDGRLRIKKGMTFAIEPMVNIGTAKTETLEDQWTVVTADRSLSAHFEHTVAVLPDGSVEVLTRDPGRPDLAV